MPMNSAMNILGMPVHVDYYTIHDPVTGIVTWAPHSNSPKSNIVSGPVPTGKTLRIGSTTQTTASAQLIIYAISAGVCFAAVENWKLSVRPYFVETYEAHLVSPASGGYFLACALTYYVIFYPVILQIVTALDSPAEASSNKEETTEDAETSSARVFSQAKQMGAVPMFMIAFVCGLVYMSMKKSTKKVAKKESEDKALSQLLAQVSDQLERNNQMQ